MAISQRIRLEYSGPMAVITLDYPQKLNSMTKDDFYQLASYLTQIAERDDILITLLIGKGKYFSAGADISVSRVQPPGTDLYRHGLAFTVASNLNLARAFYTHPKILISALNGPVVGMPAALVAHSDFIYAVPNTFLLTPFASLGLIPEGVSSLAFTQRMGITKAKEALITGKRLSSKELLDSGFINQVFDCRPGDDVTFKKLVFEEIQKLFHPDLDTTSMLKTKELISRRMREQFDAQNVEEVFGALSRSVAGIPQKQFEKRRLQMANSKL
ncbi:hypothetical protein LTR84_001167 [Exophiala bonariae]|uniref:Enoyl-CoA hydratase n=1 Tax=Exophiala bonariae TaxID=1690606 RepID=A0AAV9NUC0_9EURO|nr:hypothetical protein LTR84_001167 [Exophiala bonariae]